MIFDRIFDQRALHVLKKGIEGTLKRHDAIANNIANVDTPKYQRAVVTFEDQLRKAIRKEDVIGLRTDPAHFVIGGTDEINQIQPKVVIDHKTQFRPDQNNVNIDQEMADLALNTQRNLQYTELLTRRYAGLSNVIKTAGSR